MEHSRQDLERITALLPTLLKLTGANDADAEAALIENYKPGDPRGDGQIIADVLAKLAEVKLTAPDRSKPDAAGWFHFHCKRCENDFRSKQSAPKYCGKCKSSLWKTPRTYYVAGQPEPSGKRRRTKPTGKAAAKLRPDVIRKEKIADAEKSIENVEREYQNELKEFQREDFHNFNLEMAGYLLNNYAGLITERTFEYADLVETDPAEAFYRKRGHLYAMRDRLTADLELLEKIQEKESFGGWLNERYETGAQRAKEWFEFLNEFRRHRTRILGLIGTLKPEVVAAPPGTIVTVEKVAGNNFLIADMSGKTLAGGIGSFKKAKNIATEKKWNIQPNMF